MNKKTNIIILALLSGVLPCFNANAEMEIRPVLEVTVSSKDFPDTEQAILAKYMPAGEVQPMVFRGAANSWKDNWSSDYLTANYGHELIRPITLKNGRMDLQDDSFPYVEPLTLGEFIGNVSSHDAYYVPDNESDDVCRLIDDYPNGTIPDFFEGSAIARENSQLPRFSNEQQGNSFQLLLLGGKTHTPLHSHEATFLCQMEGSKVVTLIPKTEASALMCDIDPDDDYYDYCEVDINDSDAIKQAPIFPAWRTTIYPGDMLYIPDGWVHDVQSEAASISIVHRI